MRAVRRFRHQPLEQVPLDIGRGDSRRLVHVQGFRLRAVAPLESVVGRVGEGNDEQQRREERDDQRWGGCSGAMPCRRFEHVRSLPKGVDGNL